MTDTPPPESLRTIGDVVEAKAESNGEETFLHFEDRELSFAGLHRTSDAVAGGLHAAGVEPGDHVCLFCYNSPEYLSVLVALAKLGAVAAPIDTRFTGETLASVLSRTDAHTLFLDSRTRDDYEAIREQVPNVTNEFFVGRPDAPHQYREVDELLAGDPERVPDVAVRGTDTASVTWVQRHAAERPKGVVLPHYSYVNTGWEAGENVFAFAEDDRVFTTLPLYSIFTLQLGIMGALVAEAEFVLADKFDPDRFWDQLAAHDATVFLYLSRMLSVLYNQEASPAADLPTELAIGHGFGFDTDADLIANFEERFDITVLEGYGVTEVATIATYNYPDDRRPGSVGKPVSYADVKIVDDDDWPVSTGETGEIVVRPTRPNTMMQGYYGDPEHTVEACRNQWIHTRDIGYLDEDGYLYFVANRDNSIYRGSVAGRISSLEIESVIDAQPAVEASAVVGVRNQDGREEIKAVVVPTDGVDLSPVDVCRHCEQQLPYLKVPRYVEVREELPRNPTGKIRKRELRDGGAGDAWDRESGYELSR